MKKWFGGLWKWIWQSAKTRVYDLLDSKEATLAELIDDLQKKHFTPAMIASTIINWAKKIVRKA